VIHAGCRLRGAETAIGPGCILGEEGPVTIENCQLAADVTLKGGYFAGATLLGGVVFGSCAHVRPGTLLEEQTSCAHAVGLKQSIMMPYAVLGSLVNFCDCLLAGGTDRKNHSEVGSSYVHFNYTPQHDKATASLFGDVPRGVMLDQRPIFLGGQGGAVGPIQVEYGTVIAAGTVYRRDVTQPGMLVFGQFTRPAGEHPYDTSIYGDIRRVVANNLAYIGNLHALDLWYREVRARFAGGSPWDKACHDGARQRMREQVRERIVRLGELAANMRRSLEAAARKHAGNLPAHPFGPQRTLAEHWDAIAPRLELSAAAAGTATERDAFLRELAHTPTAAGYLDAIRSLSPEARRAGAAWLQSVVDSVVALADGM
jgi:UDP-N-acetylglucosamine/UDP-N-acetylgalactosamine diphosphorylase